MDYYFFVSKRFVSERMKWKWKIFVHFSLNLARVQGKCETWHLNQCGSMYLQFLKLMLMDWMDSRSDLVHTKLIKPLTDCLASTGIESAPMPRRSSMLEGSVYLQMMRHDCDFLMKSWDTEKIAKFRKNLNFSFFRPLFSFDPPLSTRCSRELHSSHL